jgi:conjugal transfer mating pair stabilization protein TraG
MWEIYAYHNTEALAGIFNAIAAIMASSTYLSAIAAVVFCGFVAAMIAYMFQPEKLQGWKWLISIVLVYGVLFVPRVTVGVVDKTGGTAVRIIANVPFGMAALGGLTSAIGNTITELFETAFQVLPGPSALPAELAYQQNGLMFGSRLIQETRRASIPDPAVRTDLVNFVNNCTSYDIADGTISPTAFSTSADLWTTMAATNPARFSIITSATGVTTNTCDVVYASINSRLPAQITDLTTRLGQRLNPSLASLAAQAAVVNQIPQAYIRGQIATAASTATDLIRQNAMINAINDAGEMGCQKINDPSCMMLATGRASAVASQNAAWINGAKISEQALPVVRNVAEAMCYAVFPLIVLLLFLSTGRTTLLMLTGYTAALISIQLWPPLFAILNYMATIYSQLDQAAAAEVGGGVKALALQSASPIYANAVSSQAVVSYLIIGIPMLAYALANRLVNFGSAMVGGLQGLQSASISGSPSAAAALGNSNMGNVTMDQRMVSPSDSSPFVSRRQDIDGNWITTTGDGAQATEYLLNRGAAARVISSRVSQSSVAEATRAAESARSDVVSAGSELSSALVDTMSRASTRFQSSNRSSGQALSSVEELGQSADRVRGITEQVSKATGVSASQVADIGFRLSGGVGTPGISPIKGSAMGTAGKAYRSDLSQQEQFVAQQLTNDQLREFRSFADRATRDQSFVRALGSESRDGHDLSSRLSTATSRVQSAQSIYSERQAVANRLSTSYESGEVLSIDLAQLPANSNFMQHYQRLAAEYGSESLALQAAMTSELATRALPPTRNPSLNGALPASFSDVRSAHQEDAQDPVFAGSRVTSAEQANDRAAAPRISSAPLRAPDVPTALGSVRSDVTSRAAATANTPTAADTFDQRNEITRNPDGTVGTKRSQVLGSARQLREDVTNMRDNARDLIADGSGQALTAAEEARARNSQSPRARDIKSTSDVPTLLPSSGKRTRK